MKVGVKITSQHEANVTWGAPTWNGETVTTYVVYYKKHGENNYTTVMRLGCLACDARTSMSCFLQVRTKDTWARLTDLEKGSEYNITVLAKNKHGFSAFTPLISKKIVPDEAPKTNGSKPKRGWDMPGILASPKLRPNQLDLRWVQGVHIG